MSYNEEIRSKVMKFAAKKRKEGNKAITATGMELDAVTLHAKDLLTKANVAIDDSLSEQELNKKTFFECRTPSPKRS